MDRAEISRGMKDIAVDFHGRVHKSMVKVLAREIARFEKKSRAKPSSCCYTESILR